MYLRPCIFQESVERKHAHVLKRYMILQHPCRSDLERCSPAAIRTYVSVVVRCSRAGEKRNVIPFTLVLIRCTEGRKKTKKKNEIPVLKQCTTYLAM